MLPETRDIETVSYPDEPAAKAAFDLLKSGRSLADVAQTGAKTVKSATGGNAGQPLANAWARTSRRRRLQPPKARRRIRSKTRDGWVIARVAKDNAGAPADAR